MKILLDTLRRWPLVVLLCCVGIYSAVMRASPEVDYLTFATNDEKNTTDIFSQASPAVVSVTSSALRRTMFSPNVLEVPKGAGSGFIWSEDGLIVTNFHVISGADKLTVTIAEEDFPAEVVGVAPERDLAVLRLSERPKDLTVLPLGDSAELSVGRKSWQLATRLVWILV